MGKSEPQLPLHHQQQQNHHGSSLFARCSMAFSRISDFFSFKCVFVLLLSVSVFITAIFSVFHLHHRQSGFDAKASIKHSATVQAYFRLQKPVSYLLPQIARLEYDIYAEIGVPYTKVVILSMHNIGGSNWTHVVFGVLSDPMNSPMNAVSLSVLRSSLIDLFIQRTNLTLTTSIFGHPSSFEILKFPGGITIIPKQSASIWMLPEVLFSFTLPNSIHEIEENFGELKEELKSGLHLKSYESVYVRVTNKAGSTRDLPVKVQASIVSNLGTLVPLRLKQLAQTIKGSPPSRNLGLDHYVFGKVKEISLSSYLYHTLDSPSPSPSPAPSPELNYYPLPPCSNCIVSSPSPENGPDPTSPPVSNAPSPRVSPSCGGAHISPSPSPSDPSLPPSPSVTPSPTYQSSEMPPDLPPIPVVSYGSNSRPEKGHQESSVPPPLAVLPLSSSSASGSFKFNPPTWALLFTLMTLRIL